MTLMELANQFAENNKGLTIGTKDVTNETLGGLDAKYHTPIKALVQNIKPKITVLDRFKPAYITQVFSDWDKVKAKLESLSNNGDIPDGIFLVLSKELYGKHFNDLDQSERGIIKVLSVYICIVSQ